MHRIGGLIEIRYKPSRPEQARVNRITNLWAMTLFFLAFGCMMSIPVFIESGKQGYFDFLVRPLHVIEGKAHLVYYRLTAPFYPEEASPPLTNFPQFVEAAPIPGWWRRVQIEGNGIHSIEDLYHYWHAGTYTGPPLLDSARRFYKAAYLAILNHPETGHWWVRH